MFEQVTPTVRYAKAPTAIGVVTRGDSALLVDSGLDENLVRKVVAALDREGVAVRAIVNTHAHADHFGGNAFCHERTGCEVVAPAGEAPFVERPELEGWTLFGAPAPDALRGKFILAKPSPVHRTIGAEGVVDIAGFDVRFHSLPGHSVGQMGVEVDGVLFTGDALLPERIVQKYGLVFAVDPLAARASTARIPELGARAVVSYHGGVVDDLEGAVRTNVEANERIERFVLERLARAPLTADDLFAQLCDEVGEPASVELFVLNQSTLRGYLAALERAGRLVASVEQGRMIWRLRKA